ncbi:muts domain V [Xylaria nigripes]|nr:muts domain V [Xylaria nigripes]
MTCTSSCSRLFPLLTSCSPNQLYNVPRVSLPPASAGHLASVIGRACGRRRRPRILYPSLCITALSPGGTQRRGKTTRSFKLHELPQALVRSDPLPKFEENESLPAYPTSLLQVRRNMQKFENCVLLTRIGGFYELYFNHAEEYAPLLGLKLAAKKTNAGSVSMAGFPFFQLEKYLKLLVLDLNCYVAIAEEFPNDPGDKVKSGGRAHERRVTRVITPGTLIDENFMDPYSNNFVLAIYIDPEKFQSLADSHSDHQSVGIGGLDSSSTPLGLAWLDISTGQFYTQATTVASLPLILSRVGPREIVVDQVLQSRKDHSLFSVFAEDKYLITFAPHQQFLPISEWGSMLESEMPAQKAAQFSSDEVQAGSILLQYVAGRLQGLSLTLQPPLQYENMTVLTMDKNTMRALEIKQTIRDGVFRGSLLHAVRRTVTNGGARLLNSWLTAPSTCLDIINARQDLVDYFIQNEHYREDIILLLRRSHDSQRLVQKFACGRGDADDLISLANTIRAAQDIVNILVNNTTEPGKPKPKKASKRSSKSKKKKDVDVDVLAQPSSCFASLASRLNLEDPGKLAERIRMSIDEEGLVQQHQDEDQEASHLLSMAEDVVAAEGAQGEAMLPKTLRRKKPTSVREYYADDNLAFVMKPQASVGLQELHGRLASLLREKLEMENTLRKTLSAPTLTLRWAPNLGHICHVKGKDMRAVAVTDHAAVSSTRSTRAFHTTEWTELGKRIHQTRYEINAEESRIFADLRAGVIENLVKIRRNALVLDELDVTTSFARLAIEQGLTRPILNNSTAHTIIGGRHPTVEGGLREQGRSFTKNDCLVGHTAITPSTSTTNPTSGQVSAESSTPPAQSPSGRLWLITGPNMAGKSTYLRQNALITVLAQAGCYVPASHATLGVVDAVFSRVGSADNLYSSQSTFMVEMLETAQILRNATPRSFVIMDEIGRGTTPQDGEAIAFACLHHLATVNKCRALFATHFHRLAHLIHERGLHVSSGGDDGAVEMYCTDVQEEEDGGFVYVHRLRKGVSTQSHALKVARLAGLPESTIALAEDVVEEVQHP